MPQVIPQEGTQVTTVENLATRLGTKVVVDKHDDTQGYLSKIKSVLLLAEQEKFERALLGVRRSKKIRAIEAVHAARRTEILNSNTERTLNLLVSYGITGGRFLD